MLRNFTNTQSVADQLLKLIDPSPASRPSDPQIADQQQRTLDALRRFESANWYPLAFEDASAAAPGLFSLDAIGMLRYEPFSDAPGAVFDELARLLETYLTLIAPSEATIEKWYTTAEAAEYLGVSLDTMKTYVHRRKLLKPVRKVGRTLIFAQAELDRFQEMDHPGPGRPSLDQAASE